jgi:hypothetical protein
MPAKINKIIGQQNIELVRDAIAAILEVEVDNQYLLTYDKNLQAEVQLESNNPFIDKVDLSVIAVSLLKGQFANKHQGSSDGTWQIGIEVFCKAKSTQTRNGDVISTLKMHRLLGICRYILEDPQYKTLIFQPGFILGTLISDELIYDMKVHDAVHVAGGRLIFTIRVNESNSLIVPKYLDGYDTIVKLATTQLGYRYSIDQYR